MRKSYKLHNHEYCNAHVEIHLDEDGKADKIEMWSYENCVCGAYRSAAGVWKVFCTGTYSQTIRRQISWFSSCPWQSYDEWKLSYDLFKEISEKCVHGIRKATFKEMFCVFRLIDHYVQLGKPLHRHS